MRSLRLAAVTGLLMLCAAQAEEKNGPVKIGIAVGITGPYAAFGAQIRTGAGQAIADINTAGGVGGRIFETVVGDDASDPKQGVSVANK
ncbi:MAG: ABC transporter substrate-binding protein, partial [Hyphomicrobiales bacterium]